jgi:monoamine oxidase
MDPGVDVIVVGAGFSGLAAAVELKKQGLSVLVLEARVRVGGRCQTGEYDGEAFDVGGHWIGAQQPRVRKLLTDRGFQFKAQFDQGTHVLRMFNQQHNYAGNISSLKSFGAILEESGKLIERFDADMALVPLDDPAKCPRAKEWDSITLAEWQHQNITSKEVLLLNNFLLWTIFTVTAEEISYLWWLYYLVREGHLQLFCTV